MFEIKRDHKHSENRIKNESPVRNKKSMWH